MRMRMIVLCFFLLICVGTNAAAQPATQTIYVDTERMNLILYEDGMEAMRFPIAAGAKDTPTPLGVFRITGRFRTQRLNGFGTCFLALDVPWGQYGIHGTNQPGSIGSHASHGCIRMYVSDAEKLYARVRTGTQVVIQGSPYGDLGYTLRPLVQGERGNLVRAVQCKLRALGYLNGSCDGVFGEATAQALRRFQKEHHLKVDGSVNAAVYEALGLMLFE
jgi:hypothetical protein